MLEAGFESVVVLCLLSPLWTPVALAFYAIWRERLTRKMIAAFVLAECVSFGLAYYALRVTAWRD
jgi:hypothetical protein